MRGSPVFDGTRSAESYVNVNVTDGSVTVSDLSPLKSPYSLICHRVTDVLEGVPPSPSAECGSA